MLAGKAFQTVSTSATHELSVYLDGQLWFMTCIREEEVPKHRMSIAQVQHRAQIRSINTYNAGAVHFQSVIHITFYLFIYTWWTSSVKREVTTWILSWSSLNYRVGQTVTKFSIFLDPTHKLFALPPERHRIR